MATPENGSITTRATRSRELAANRRRHDRLLWEHHHLEPLMLEAEAPGEEWHQVPCTLVDVGPGGVGILASQPLPPGSLVRVTFALPPHPEDEEALEPVPWSGLGEVVHTRHMPERVHEHVPEAAHRPHHHGVRFGQLEHEAESRLLRALYGPMPSGWAVERYSIHRAKTGDTTRYAVVRDGKRIAQGFKTYDRARARAWSLHMDELAESRVQS